MSRTYEFCPTDLAKAIKQLTTRNTGDNIIFEYDGSSNMLASYTHSPLAPDDILSASITSAGVTAGLATTQGHFYYLKDALGSITEIMNTSGSVVQKYDYSSFGKIISIKDGSGVDISASPVVKTSFAFTGREWDEESGLFYYRARGYSPEIGRFLQSDPYPGKLNNPFSIVNKYIYAANSPLQFRDPTGCFLENLIKLGGMLENIGKFMDNLRGQGSLGEIAAYLLDPGQFRGVTSSLGQGISTIGKQAFSAGRKYFADEPYKLLKGVSTDRTYQNLLNIQMNFQVIGSEAAGVGISFLAAFVSPNPFTVAAAFAAIPRAIDTQNRSIDFLRDPTTDKWEDRTLLDMGMDFYPAF